MVLVGVVGCGLSIVRLCRSQQTWLTRHKRAKGHAGRPLKAPDMYTAYIPVVCQCPAPSTGTVRPKVPRYVFVTLPLCGETNLREAFLNCAASYLFVLHYEERVPSGCWYTRRRSTLANCGSDGKDSFHTRTREPSLGARRISEPGTQTMMLNSLSVFQVDVPLTPV